MGRESGSEFFRIGGQSGRAVSSQIVFFTLGTTTIPYPGKQKKGGGNPSRDVLEMIEMGVGGQLIISSNTGSLGSVPNFTSTLAH